jgi:hypothetical protein
MNWSQCLIIMDENKFIKIFLTVFGSIAFVGVVLFTAIMGLEDLSKEVILLIGASIGTLGSQYQKPFEFVFGSSQSSSMKNDTINTLSKEIKK